MAAVCQANRMPTGMIGAVRLHFVGRRELTAEQGARVAGRLRVRLERTHGGNVLAFSRELQISQSSLWKLFNDRASPSFATAEALARVEGIPVETLLTGPRERAAALAREVGVPEGAIRRVLEQPEDDPPRPVLDYVDLMRLYARLDQLSGAEGAKKAS